MVSSAGNDESHPRLSRLLLTPEGIGLLATEQALRTCVGLVLTFLMVA